MPAPEIAPKIAAFLLAPAGAAALARAEFLPATDHSRLADLSTLRRDLPPAVAGAVWEQVRLRRQAATKFERAAAMLLTPAGLQQASAAPVAAHRATRFAGRRAADLTAGIGGDAVALAATAARLVALDRDSVRLRFARHNLGVYGRLADYVAGDLLASPLAPGAIDAAFCDPGRRGPAGARVFDPAAYEPPLAAILAAYAAVDLAVKVGPGIDYDALLAGGTVGEVEIVSLRGDVKEAVLWTRGLATPGVRRRATLLPEGATLTDADVPDTCPVTSPQAYLYEPDGAVIRAGLVRPLAQRLGLAQIDPEVAYLTGPAPLTTPFARGFAVDEVHPFSLKALNRRLAALQVGRVELKKRAFAVEPEALRPRLRLHGDEARTIVFTRLGAAPTMLICRPL